MTDLKISQLTDGGGILATDEVAVNRAGASFKARVAGVDGWIDASAETWTYASADAPTFAFTVTGDQTAKYTPGTRLKLTQTTVKYFIVTAVSVAGGTTTVTIYGGTDYTLANAAISANSYSRVKGPAGFPLDPTKWTEKLSDTADRTQAGVTQNTWYNMGSLSLSIPIGAWHVLYEVIIDDSGNATNVIVRPEVSLSTSNNSESDKEFGTTQWQLSSTTDTARIIASLTRDKYLTLAAKTTYFLIARETSTHPSTLDFRGDIKNTVIRAVCAYL